MNIFVEWFCVTNVGWFWAACLETVLFPSISYITVKHGCIFSCQTLAYPWHLLVWAALRYVILIAWDIHLTPNRLVTGDSATLVPSTGLEPPPHMLILSFMFSHH